MSNEKEKEAERVEQQYTLLGMTAPQFQRAMGIKSQHWTNWKKRGIPKAKLQKVSKIINKPVDWILLGIDYIDGEVVRHNHIALAYLPNQDQKQTPAVAEPNCHHKAIESNATWLGDFDLWDHDTPLRDDEVALPFFREVKLAAGKGITEVQENHGTKLRFAKSTLKRQGVNADTAACVVVDGNSMEPVLPHGSTVGIDTSKTNVINGKMYAIDHDGQLRVKLLYQIPGGGLRLRSYNDKEWPDEPYSDISKIRILGQVFWSSVLW